MTQVQVPYRLSTLSHLPFEIRFDETRPIYKTKSAYFLNYSQLTSIGSKIGYSYDDPDSFDSKFL